MSSFQPRPPAWGPGVQASVAEGLRSPRCCRASPALDLGAGALRPEPGALLPLPPQGKVLLRGGYPGFVQRSTADLIYFILYSFYDKSDCIYFK